MSVLVGVVAFGWTLVVSLSQWFGGNSSTFDLGLFAQVAQAWASGGPPYSRIRGLNVLGEHFSPILVVLGPAWAVWPDPRVLLVVQSLLLAVTVGVLVRVVAARVGRTVLALYVLVVLTGYGLVAALTFDFHEVAFAPLFVVLLGLGLLRRRLVLGLIGSVGLVVVKEDLGLTVLAAAATWWLLDRRQIKAPLSLATVGIAGLLAGYLTIYLAGHDFGGVYLQRLGSSGPAELLASVPYRLVPAGSFVAATFVVGLRSPVVGLAVPTLAWRAASSTTSYWTIDYHYDLVLWAVAALALADRSPSVLADLSRRRKVVLAVLVLINLGLSSTRFIGEATPVALFQPSPVITSIRQLSVHLPPGAPIAAQDKLGSYLIPRNDVSALDVASDQPVQYAIFMTTDAGGGLNRAPLCARQSLARQAVDNGWNRWADGPVMLVQFPSRQVPPMPRC